jgi:chaperonin GroEL (HSP60 family)
MKTGLMGRRRQPRSSDYLLPFSELRERFNPGEVVVEKLKACEWEVGYNAMTDKYENLVDAGVIDPAKVPRCALQNAASVAGMVLTTQAIVVEKAKPKKPAPAVPEGSLMV